MKNNLFFPRKNWSDKKNCFRLLLFQHGVIVMNKVGFADSRKIVLPDYDDSPKVAIYFQNDVSDGFKRLSTTTFFESFLKQIFTNEAWQKEHPIAAKQVLGGLYTFFKTIDCSQKTMHIVELIRDQAAACLNLCGKLPFAAQFRDIELHLIKNPIVLLDKKNDLKPGDEIDNGKEDVKDLVHKENVKKDVKDLVVRECVNDLLVSAASDFFFRMLHTPLPQLSLKDRSFFKIHCDAPESLRALLIGLQEGKLDLQPENDEEVYVHMLFEAKPYGLERHLERLTLDSFKRNLSYMSIFKYLELALVDDAQNESLKKACFDHIKLLEDKYLFILIEETVEGPKKIYAQFQNALLDEALKRLCNYSALEPQILKPRSSFIKTWGSTLTLRGRRKTNSLKSEPIIELQKAEYMKESFSKIAHLYTSVTIDREKGLASVPSDSLLFWIMSKLNHDKIVEIRISNMAFTNVDFINLFPNLSVLHINNNQSLQRLVVDVNLFSPLSEVSFNDCAQLEDIESLYSFLNLKSLDLRGTKIGKNASLEFLEQKRGVIVTTTLLSS